MSSTNQTTCINISDDSWHHYLTNAPFYYTSNEYLIDGIPDRLTALASPIIVYWLFSMFFHCLDVSGWKWPEKYRIHESEEVKAKNLVSRSHVAGAVVVQQTIQTLIGLLWMPEEKRTINHGIEIRDIGTLLGHSLCWCLGQPGRAMLPHLLYMVYWWLIPIAQLLFAMFVIDTWQYFLHRLMHTNKYLYRQFHSWHHRLYVPYAFGSLYNHPFEGFLLDTLGAGLAELLAGMTTRQAMVLFVLSTVKTVDDHCGYSLPFDPLQILTSNNADYHDIHHQAIGIKSNFSQPFFVHWDVILGTRLTRQDIEHRRHRGDAKTA